MQNSYVLVVFRLVFVSGVFIFLRKKFLKYFLMKLKEEAISEVGDRPMR